jgi:hypothetical protein
VRRRIADFASRLDNASNDERPGWLKRLRSIVRRVQPTLPGIIVVHGTAALLGLGATVALAPVAPPVLVTAAAGLIKIAATKVLERLYPPDTATSKEPTSANEQQAVGDRLRVALDLADLARGHETLKTLATGASLDSAQAPPGRAVAEAQVRCMVDELFAATFLAIEALPVGPASQPLLEALTRLADASAPVAAALTRPVPDPAEALRWWPEYEYAFWEAARAVAHDEPPPPDTLSW